MSDAVTKRGRAVAPPDDEVTLSRDMAELSQPAVQIRPDLRELTGYHSAQVEVEVRLNTNESPLAPPAQWLQELVQGVVEIDFNRYPDRNALALRQALADFHGVSIDEIFCANGSNEVLQSLLLAYGGPTRCAAVFEPTYALHSHIASLTSTEVLKEWRTPDFRIDLDAADRLIAERRPVITFICSPNNPTGLAEPVENVRHILDCSTGLVVVDEAYGQFAPWSALTLAGDLAAAGNPARRRLVVVRTFSKTWSMAACRLGYLVASPEVVAACETVALPYHLDAFSQLAGTLALQHVDAMEQRVSLIAEERGRIMAAMADMEVEFWPSDANFVLFRPITKGARQVWEELVETGILVRDCSTWPGLSGCLRVTVGTPRENERFVKALGLAVGAQG